MRTVIDVSHWNTVADYGKVKADGVEAAIVKVNNTSATPDKAFETHVRGFKGAGIPCNMGYTYCYANTIPKALKAAQGFVDIGKPNGIDYMWLDLEDGTMQGLGSELLDIIGTYRGIAEKNSMRFGIYTYIAYYNANIKPYLSKLSDIPLWIAYYPGKAACKTSDRVPSTTKLPGGMTISGWQYSSNCNVNGITGGVDISAWYDDGAIKIDSPEITAYYNPFTEPTGNCNVGTLGNDADWCLYCLWRCGFLLNDKGEPDASRINGVYTNETKEKVRQVQQILGLTADGIVGKQTRSVLKKIIA